jgi:hypothetical protein
MDEKTHNTLNKSVTTAMEKKLNEGPFRAGKSDLFVPPDDEQLKQLK